MDNLPTQARFLRRWKHRKIYSTANLIKGAIIATSFMVTWVIFILLPVTYLDWIEAYQPAALNWQNPYFKPGVIFNPPWIFPFLYPFALLPSQVGAGLLMVVAIIILTVYLRSTTKLLLIMMSAPIAVMISLGQLDFLLLIGLMLPYGLGIPLLLIKPQGVFLAILLRLQVRGIVVTIVTIIFSVIIWGGWWHQIIGHQPNQEVNVSLFPYTIPLGIPLLYWGYKHKSDAFLCFASLCFTPYFMMHSMLPALAAFVKENEDWRLYILAILASWLYLTASKLS